MPASALRNGFRMTTTRSEGWVATTGSPGAELLGTELPLEGGSEPLRRSGPQPSCTAPGYGGGASQTGTPGVGRCTAPSPAGASPPRPAGAVAWQALSAAPGGAPSSHLGAGVSWSALSVWVHRWYRRTVLVPTTRVPGPRTLTPTVRCRGSLLRFSSNLYTTFSHRCLRSLLLRHCCRLYTTFAKSRSTPRSQ